MLSDRRRQTVGLVLALLFLVVTTSAPVRSLVAFPSQLQLLLGEEQRIGLLGLPVPAVIHSDQDGLLEINDQRAQSGDWRVNLSTPLSLRPVEAGRCSLDLSVLGFITLRRVTVNVAARPVVVPGGQSIGILLRTLGVTVVGYAPVEAAEARVSYPAREAGIRVGDVVLKVDEVAVKSSHEIVFLVNRCARQGRAVPIDLGRGAEVIRVQITPLFSVRERVFQLGLYVRDGAAGVGTLTFYEPASRVFMALGHVISDAATNSPLEMRDGRVVRATVARVRPGRRGEPGEKEGTFVEDQDVIGSITANTEFGLVGLVTDEECLTDDESGAASDPLASDSLGEDEDGSSEGRDPRPDPGRVEAATAPVPLPIALAREVALGPAEIRTVVTGTQVESFAVEIIRVDPAHDHPSPKGITLRVVDPELLEATGGIVQGMSGSPIIQNGRLVGAVTHVFVNDPTRGYGVFAEWMAREAGLMSGASEPTSELVPLWGTLSCPADSGRTTLGSDQV